MLNAKEETMHPYTAGTAPKSPTSSISQLITAHGGPDQFRAILHRHAVIVPQWTINAWHNDRYRPDILTLQLIRALLDAPQPH